MDAEKRVLGEGKATMELCRIDPRRGFWLVTGGTVGLAGDVVRVPDVRELDPSGCQQEVTPFDAEFVVDSVTREVLLPESSRPKSRLGQAMGLVRLLEEAGLHEQAQIVRDWLCGSWEEDLRDRRAA